MSQAEIFTYIASLAGSGGAGAIITSVLAHRRATRKAEVDQDNKLINQLLHRVIALEKHNFDCQKENIELREIIAKMQIELALLKARTEQSIQTGATHNGQDSTTSEH